MIKQANRSLYKYTDVQGAKCILRDLTLLFKTPDLFNDPNDCDFVINDGRVRKAFALVEEYETLVAFRDIVEESQGKVKKSQGPILAYGKWVLNTQTKIVAKSHEFDSNPVFRFLIRWKMRQSQEYEAKRKEALEKYIAQMKEGFSRLKNTIYVCCFSKRPDSILMWSHYADEFKGVCIEWDRSVLSGDLHDVSYARQKPTFDILKAIKILLGYALAGQDPDINNPVFRRMVLELLVTKGSDWSYENEIRWIVQRDELFPGKFDLLERGRAICHLDISLPKKVLLGERMSEQDEADIRSLCSDIGCEVVKTKTGDTEFAVTTENGHTRGGEEPGPGEMRFYAWRKFARPYPALLCHRIFFAMRITA